MSEWTKTPPTIAGRYWWRAPSQFPTRPELGGYGILLVAWCQYGEFEPQLRAVSVACFSGVFGGEQEGGGWSSSGGGSPHELLRQYPGIEFWSEPERGPGDFLPLLGGRPDWTPPDPKVVAERNRTSNIASAARERKETAERAKRIADAAKDGIKLYECKQCDLLIDEGDLVQVRECPHDDEKFNGTENGQACPSCSRRFSRNITEHGCFDCLEECEPLVTEEAAAPTKKRRR